MKKLRLAIDFDGVINSYKSGWKGLNNLPDPPVPGTIGWMTEAIDAGHTVIIFSMRNAAEEYMLPYADDIYSKYDDAMQMEEFSKADYIESDHVPYDFHSRWQGVEGIKSYLMKWGMEQKYVDKIEFAFAKPHFDILFDDRAYRFEGVFPPVSELNRIAKPWWKK